MLFSFVVFVLAFIIITILIAISSRRQALSPATAKDNLLYGVMFITLCLSVYNFIEIIFTAIDQYFPDALGNQFFYQDTTRFAIASLMILFPLYIAFAFLISKSVYADILKKDLAIRKIFFYLVAIIMGFTIITTMIYTIYHWLGGEATNRFITKAIVIIAISIGLILYSLYSLNRDFTKKTKIPFIIALFTTIIVFTSILGSVLVLGTPTEMRKIKADEQRIAQLQNVESAIVSYTNRYKKLPQTLEEASDQININPEIMKDPMTKQNYEYKILQDIVYIEERGYDKCRRILPSSSVSSEEISNVRCMVPQIAKIQLCAVFESEKNLNNVYDDWAHVSGKHCFDRVIDIIDSY